MMEISQPTVKCVETNEDKSYGKYTIAPLERGFGTTLGNSLRRVLLSSLSGAAVTSIKIEKIKHEFSTVPGIIEDMTEIILNIKGIRAKLHNESNIVSISVAKGRTGELTAGDIVHGPEVEIMGACLHHAAFWRGGVNIRRARAHYGNRGGRRQQFLFQLS